MTEYYRSESNRRSHLLDDADVSAGCVVAARWPGDDRWYRARVVEVVRDEYDDGAEPQLDVDFVDFGDCDKKNRGEVFDLRADFLRLSFQAIECCLAGVEPMYVLAIVQSTFEIQSDLGNFLLKSNTLPKLNRLSY